MSDPSQTRSESTRPSSIQEKVILKPKPMPKQKETKDREPEVPDVPETLRPTENVLIVDTDNIAAKILVHVTDSKSLKKILEDKQLTPGTTRHKRGRTQNHFANFTDFVRTNKLQDFPPMDQLTSQSSYPITISRHRDIRTPQEESGKQKMPRPSVTCLFIPIQRIQMWS